MILEPIPHNVGALLPGPGFLARLRSLCDAHGALLIFDEVITGFRHGLGGYQEIAGVLPTSRLSARRWRTASRSVRSAAGVT